MSDTTPVMTNSVICSADDNRIRSIQRPGGRQRAVVLPTLVQVRLLGHSVHGMLRRVVLAVPDPQDQRPRHLLLQLGVQTAAAGSPNPLPCCSHDQHESFRSGETVSHGKHNSIECF